MKILAIDTSTQFCAACVLDTKTLQEDVHIELDSRKGYAEHLVAAINDAFQKSWIQYSQIGVIGVSVGPGSFTGVRVGVAAARGLSLALKIPAVGVSSLEAVAAESRLLRGRRTSLVAFPGAQNLLRIALFDEEGAVLLSPRSLSLDEVASLVEKYNPIVAGSAFSLIASHLGDVPCVGSEKETADINIYAQLTAKYKNSKEKPKPIYLGSPWNPSPERDGGIVAGR